MARDGSGTYALPATMAVSGAVASSVTVNSIMNDIAQALTDSINKDGTKAFGAAQSMGGNRLTSLGAATALTDAAQYSQLQKGNVSRAITVAGTVDAITLAFNPTITSLTTGMKIRWVSGGANTIAGATINVDSLGAVTVKKNPGAVALLAGDLGVSGTENEAVYNGTNWVLVPNGVSNFATTTDVLTGTSTSAGATPDAIAVLWEKGSDIASASTITVGEGGYFYVTGTTGISDIDFGTDKTGRKVWLMFAGALTLTHSASLILPGGVNITTVAGDAACFVSDGSADVVRCIAYQRSSGLPVVNPTTGPQLLGTITTTSGTSQSLTSLVLTGYKFLRLVFNGVSGSSTGVLSIGSLALLASAAAVDADYGFLEIELSTGIASGSLSRSNGTAVSNYYNGTTGITNASTSVTASLSAGNFDLGSINVYGW